jgi:Rhodopirellula transposase DDE domain
VRRNRNLEAVIRRKYLALTPVLDERTRRLWAATESQALGYGGDALVAGATGLARDVIRAGRKDLEEGLVLGARQRRPGGGRKSLAETQGGWVQILEDLVAPSTRGDPMSPLRWTCKSTRNLADELRRKGFEVSHTSVAKELHILGYSLHVLRKNHEGEDPGLSRSHCCAVHRELWNTDPGMLAFSIGLGRAG